MHILYIHNVFDTLTVMGYTLSEHIHQSMEALFHNRPIWIDHNFNYVPSSIQGHQGHRSNTEK